MNSFPGGHPTSLKQLLLLQLMMMMMMIYYYYYFEGGGVPSRKTVHGKGVGLKFRIRGTRPVGIRAALGATRKIKFYLGNSLRRPLPRPFFLGPRGSAHAEFSGEFHF